MTEIPGLELAITARVLNQLAAAADEDVAHAAESLGVAPELLASTVALLRMVPR